jgi:hypothetical protein
MVSEDFAAGLTETTVGNILQVAHKKSAKQLLSKETCLYATVTRINTVY